MIIAETQFKGLYTIEPKVHEDFRGFFMEVYRRDVFREQGLDLTFVQDNQSRSKKNVIRALHFQYDPPIGKLMRVTLGEAFVAAVDIRKNSPTFGKHLTFNLSDKNKKMLYASPGFAMGFCAMSDLMDMQYRFTALYNPKGEANILWNDTDIGIVWPISGPILSDRDKSAQDFKTWLAKPESDLFSYMY
ncbi:MAG: dTDP-4-dehydrorhamnose 3,5-epimerase [Patescibacteria group bacterium]